MQPYWGERADKQIQIVPPHSIFGVLFMSFSSKWKIRGKPSWPRLGLTQQGPVIIPILSCTVVRDYCRVLE